MNFINRIFENISLSGIAGYFRNTNTSLHVEENDPALQLTEHDKEMLRFYSHFVSQGDLVFDVGANIGNRTKIFLKLRLEVISIEPQEHCVKRLITLFGSNEHLTILHRALGASEGEAEILISNANTISSMSPDWIDAVKSSGRFADYTWEKAQAVKMTTLDSLIEIYGVPTLIKVDVEGFEYEVIKGLSRPIKFISLEFTPEFIDSSFKCIEHLETLGRVMFNYSLGENMQLELDDYVSSNEIIVILESYRHNYNVFGDVYCQFVKC